MKNEKTLLLTLIPLFLVLIIDSMGMGIILPILTKLFFSADSTMLPITASIGLRTVIYSLTFISFFFFMFFGAPILGDFSDKYGRKKILLACLFFTGVAYLISAIGVQHHSLFLLLLGRVLAGFMAGSQPIAQAAIIDISKEEDKAKNLGLITFAACVGFILGPLLGAYFSGSLVTQFSIATPFFMAAILAFANASILSCSFKETFSPGGKVKIIWYKGLNLFFSAFANKKLRTISITFFLQELSWGLYFQFVLLYLVEQYHFTAKGIGFFIALLGFSFGVTLLFLVRVCQRFLTLYVTNYFASLLMAFGVLINLCFHSEIGLLITLIFITIGNGLSYNSLLTIYSNSVEKSHQGWIMGVSSAMLAASWVIAGLCIYFIELAGFYVAFTVIGLTALSCFFFAYRLLQAETMDKNKKEKL